MTDEGTRRWRRPERASTVSDALQLLRMAIVEIREDPDDADARRRLRATAAEQALWDQLAALLADEARAHAHRPAIAAALYEELAGVHETLDQPLETIAAMEALVEVAPDVIAHRDRLASLYRQAGAWAKAADAYEEIARRAGDRVADAALLSAAKLNRDHGRLDHAEAQLRRIVERRPTDLGAWRGLDDVLCELGRWREVAEVRGERAARAHSGFEKAALLRSQARALEQAGDLPAAAHVKARASTHAPDVISGLVDQADVLARGGQGAEAVAILRARVDEAIDRGASPDDVAALRLRLAQVLEDTCDDRAGATLVLGELLADAPEHLPALERITALAATDPDPRVHAAALLRYAAAVPDAGDRAAYVAAAGRRFRDAGDHAAATQALEHAAALAPSDQALARELADLRTTAVVAAAGDHADAEPKLRAILATHPHHVEANLALADLLVATDRIAAAADHLHQLPAVDARLVYRLAQVMDALGDADESHQLLHEAHRLDRGSLAITLALGESCFARKLWRQAVLHLAAAGDHPDAARHAGAVATGLVHAAVAEIRALKPLNAGKHYEAAVRIDPACALAWHGLAEIATERGELARAADCLEHEAVATTEPKDRLRLFDALGDMALEILADPARAERCWAQVADAGSAAVLDKLLALQRQRDATLERADTCARRARLEADAPRRLALLLEAGEALLSGGAADRAVVLADEVIASHPRDPDVVLWATTIAMVAGDPKRASTWARRLVHADDPRAGLELVAAMGAPLSDDDQRVLEAPARAMAPGEAYAAALDDDDRRELIDDAGERPLRDVLAILAEALPAVCPPAPAALAASGLVDPVRVSASSDVAAAAMYPQIARALGGPPTLLYTHPDAALTLLFASPPVVILGRGEATRFHLGRVVELSRPHRIFAAMPDDALARLIAGLRHAFGPAGASAPPDVVAEAERLRGKLTVAQRQRLTERLAAIAPRDLEPAAYVAACHRAADRAGLIACGDVGVAIALAGGAQRASYLVRLASSKRYLAVRKKLRAR